MKDNQVENQVKTYRCSFELALDIISGKWKLSILHFIYSRKVIRYSELRKNLADINERMLTRQLRELEKDKLIERKVYNQVPPKVEYSLSEVGETIIPLMETLRDWGKVYNEKVTTVCIENSSTKCDKN